ncbi:MAG: hypothetical protein ACJ8F3_18600 [Xanthobacteraceae bacterium]
MILTHLVAAGLVLSVATGPVVEPTALSLRSPQQKNAAVQPMVRSATECIVRTVTGDPRYGERNVGDLIVESMGNCIVQMRAMIDAYDRVFGDGTGEAFFSGPYLDLLPMLVTKTGRAD